MTLNFKTPNTDLGEFVVGEVPAPLQYEFLDSDGVPINLTGYTVQYLIREQHAAKSTTVVRTGALITPLTGIVGYTWTALDFLDPGSYISEFKVTNTVQTWVSILITFAVRQAVGP